MTPDSTSTHSEHHVHGESRNTRREARELALRMLFQLDLGKQPTDEVIAAALAQSRLEGGNRLYSEELVRGALEHQAEIDGRITALTPDWTPDRQAAVDRNILRLAAYELLYRPDAPVAAVVNEAIELAKKWNREWNRRRGWGRWSGRRRPCLVPTSLSTRCARSPCPKPN